LFTAASFDALRCDLMHIPRGPKCEASVYFCLYLLKALTESMDEIESKSDNFRHLFCCENISIALTYIPYLVQFSSV